MSTEPTTPMNTEKPDYGEPWRDQMGTVRDRMEYLVSMASPETRDRIIACVNACAGMPDPAAEIEAMRKEIERFKANNRYQRGYHHGEQSKAEEIRAMREAMKAAYEALAHLQTRDWYNSDYTERVKCTLDPTVTRAAIAKLQPFVKP